MIIIILYFVPQVFTELSPLHNVYESRKPNSHSDSFKTGYVSGRFDDSPGIFATFDTEMERRMDYEPKSTSNYILTTIGPYSNPGHMPRPIIENIDVTKTSMPKRDLLLEKKSNSKYNPGFLPSKLETDAMYEHLKSAMHYKLPDKTEPLFGYESDYHVDDNDVRTSSRGLHDSWPFYYYNPYEYEHMRIDIEREKAKDKRYAVDATRIIPIHEDLSDDIPYLPEPLLTTTDFYFTSTDNPMSGHDPFFSVMLNDYFNKNYDYGDQLTLKGIDWNNEDLSDQGISRFRRLPKDYVPKNTNIDLNGHHRQNEFGTAIKQDIEAERGLSNNHNFNKNEKSNAKKANDRSTYHQNDLKQIGFKDFVDNFANKFGSEDHKKDSNYIMKMNKDKGEHRKGFRRVYHKDEYQEDNEFYDNNNSSAAAEEKGSSNAHVGGSEGLSLKSTSSANLGNQASAYNKSGGSENNNIENNRNAHDDRNSHNKQFYRYRDVAKQAAQSNDADYSVNEVF